MDDRLSTLMLNALIKGGINELTRAAYEYLNLPIMISDAQCNYITHIDDKAFGDPFWDEILENGQTPLQRIIMYNNDDMMQFGARQNGPYFLDWGFLKNNPRIIGNIVVNDTMVGYVTILCNSCTKEILEAVGIICNSFAIEFKRKNINVGNIPNPWRMFLTSLLSGKIHDDDQLNQWLMQLERKINGYFCIVAAKPSKSATTKTLLPYIQRDIERIDPRLCPVVFDNSIYFLIMDHETNESCREKVDILFEKLSSLDLCFGVSNRFLEIMQIEIYRKQASFALSVCQENDEVLKIYYNNCAFAHLLKTVEENLPVKNYIHPALGTLKVHDQENGTDYLATLHTYILSMCDPAETVAELHIHRNTLPYRLKTIERIADINLSHRETLAHLLFSFSICEFI